jgi:DNA-directed RNA polymerase subunit RPC12/RpoP
VSTPDEARALAAEHKAGKHAAATLDADYVIGDGYFSGCPRCWADVDALTAKLEAEEAASLKAYRKAALAAEREEARVRAAWIKANPDAIAWRCAECSAEFTDADADQGQGGVYECGSCGSTFSRANSADGDSNRCAECGHFGSKLADLACPECNEGELEPVGEETPV